MATSVPIGQSGNGGATVVPASGNSVLDTLGSFLDVAARGADVYSSFRERMAAIKVSATDKMQVAAPPENVFQQQANPWLGRLTTAALVIGGLSVAYYLFKRA